MENKHIGWIRVLILILPYLFVVAGFQLVAALITNIDINDRSYQETSFQRLIMSFFNLLGTFFILWIFMRFLDKNKFINLGFHTKGRLNEFVTGVGLGAVIMGIGYLILLFINEIQYKEIVFDPKEFVISILVFSLVAIVEEVLLRGYVLRNLMISFNKYVALLVSSALFAIMHGFNPNLSTFSLFGLFLAGLLLGISYIYTKNLWFPIALHFSWNFFQTHFGFNVSGIDFYSLIETEITNYNVLNGGAFGFEGSIFSITAEILGIIGIGYYYFKRHSSNNISVSNAT
ncbi:CPBP family intramembrane glutamic endopeptidase [Aquimarina sp. AU474]|uniref:CPBP family intramembrane glutamic endopeptidase n=1 Tax=Aquimarina sp. AU474 TaxID=2108529 RepID=UPI000D68DC50|nr:type II CAAX endopeptidase family protein [Aquimarina sp. AU474]